MATMTSERQIWEAAVLLVRCHGEHAAQVAALEARRRGVDDRSGRVVWAWIARVTAELIRLEPDVTERVH
ncbi:MAG TPA: hypothetical protein VMU87_14900 [Stellaceae bacterium]|nr:hypothetical protein [Stellaceae bacterium]